MDFTALIQKLRDSLKQVSQRANDLLSKQPPLEQFEKTGPVYSGLLSCGYAIDFLKQTVTDLSRELDAIDPEAAIKAGAEDVLRRRVAAGELIEKTTLDDRLSKGELLTKEVAQAAADTAANDREKNVRLEILTVENRRKEISTPKGDKPALLTAEATARISMDVLKADDYLTKVETIAQRVKDLNALGVEVPGLLNKVADFPVDDAGNTQFKEQLTLVKDIAAKANKGGSSAPEPLAGGGRSGDDATQPHELAACF